MPRLEHFSSPGQPDEEAEPGRRETFAADAADQDHRRQDREGGAPPDGERLAADQVQRHHRQRQSQRRRTGDQSATTSLWSAFNFSVFLESPGNCDAYSNYYIFDTLTSNASQNSSANCCVN